MQFINNFENMLNNPTSSELKGVVSPRKSNLYRGNNSSANPGLTQYPNWQLSGNQNASAQQSQKKGSLMNIA